MDRKAGALRRQRLAAQATLALLVIVLAPLAWANAQSAPGPAAPAAPGGSTEVPEFRTATSKTFKHTDGRLTKRLYAEPVHYREGGRWKDIDSSLIPTAPAERGQGYAWRTKSNGFGVLLKPRLEPGYLRFDISRQSFSFGLAGARPVAARTNGPRVEYPDALPGVDVRYEMRPEGVKEELVLRDADAPSKLRFTIDAPERLRTAAARRDDGSVELFAGGRGKPSFVLTPPFATDAANGHKRAGAATRRLSRDAAGHVSMSVERVGGRYEVELAVDEDWLRDPKRRFPVTVDPSITIQPTTKSAEFTATCPGCSGYDWGSVDLGTDDVDAYRGAFQFDLSDVPPGAAVSSASLGLYNQADWCVWTTFDACGAKSHQLNVHRITSSWTVNTLTRNLLFDATPLTSYTLPIGAGDQWMTWGVTPTVQAWLNGTQPNYGLMVKRATEPLDIGGPEVPGGTWVDGDPGLRPRLDVTYTADAVRFFKPETLHGNGADLRWSRFDGSTGNTFGGYEVHRSATSSFTPSASTRVATITDVATTSFRDTTAAPGKAFSYKIVTNGKPSLEQRVTLPADGQASKTLQPSGSGTATTIDDFDGPATCGNYGADSWLYVGSDWYRERSLLDFDLRDIPSGASITAATLSVWMDEPPYAPMTVGAYRVSSNWDEGTGVWGDCTGDGASWAERTGSVAWDTPGGDYVSTPVATKAHTASDARGWDNFDIRTAVQTWASGGAPNQGILLRATNESDVEGKWLSYLSDDYGANPARLPKLAITYADSSKVIAPTAAITAPTGADTLHGTVSVEATASDDRRVDSVEFLVDGVSKATDTTAPFAYSWITTAASNGTHTLTARATDDAGNVTTSSARTVQVGNSAAPTTRVTYPSGAYHDVAKADGPSAYWRLGETTGTTAADASGNARTATYAGAATLNQPSLLTGNVDPAVKLTSGGTVTATSLAGILSGALTAEAWVSTTGGNQRVVSRGWGAAGGWQLALTRDAAGVQRAEFAIDRGTSGIARASALVTAGKLHLAGTFDGTTARLYVNGGEVASAGASGATLTTTAGVIVGGVLDAALVVDEVALYARAVAADHLRVHADGGSGKPATVQGEGTVVEAAAADDGTVKRVEFYADGNRFAEDASAPYTGTLPTLTGDTPLYDGTHDITTKAYDDHDLMTASATTKIAVANTANTIYQAGFNATAAPLAVTYTPSAATQEKSGFDITVTNTSQQTWSATNVVLRPRWIPPDPSATPIPGTEVSLGASLPPGQAKQVQVLVEPPALPVGVDKAQYTLQVDAVDKTTGKAFADKGNKPVENPVIVNKAIETGLGLEKYYQYDGEELGAGMNQLVNVASGNSIVRWTPMSSPGRGLSTVLDLTYNSLEKKSESPVGNNFSLSISGLSRFGNPIDIHPNKADEIGGRANKFVDVTDGDGTTHHFEGRQAADGSTYWVEPAGVHLYLRSLGTADPARRWAFTRPDRVTFYFDADGYPTSIEDGNGNRITYTLEDTPPGEDPGGPKRRITRVTDAGGRSYDVAYYSKADAKKPHIRGKVRRITDHTGNALDFEYYEDGNLLRLIQRGGPNPDGTLLADRTFVFTYTTPNGDAPALSAAERVNPDPHTPSQSTRLFSVRDPRGRETTFAYLGTGNGDDRWKLASRTDRGGVTTSFAYDTLNRVTTVNAPLARVSKYAYDTEGKVTRITNPENQSTDVAWTADRMVASVTEPNGKATRYAYNANGYLTTETDQLDRVTRLSYEDLAVDTADVAGKWATGRTIPHISQLKTKTTPRGKVWTFAYDPRGNLTSVKDPENAETRHAYDPVNGNLTQTTDPNGNAQQFLDYDLNGLVGRAVDAENRTTRFEHDADGLLLSVQDPLHTGDTGPNPREYRMIYDYDAFERMVRQSRPKSTRFDRGKLIWSAAEFDPNDNVVRSLGAHYGAQYAPALSSVAERSYDAMDQLTEAIRPHAQGAAANTLERTQIAYDAAGRRQSVTSPRGVATTTDARDFAVFYDYDKLDRVIRSTREGDPGDATRQVRSTHFCFDQVGDLRSVTAPRAGLATVTCGTAGAPAGTPYTNRIDYTFAHEATVRTDPNGNKTELGYDLDGNVRTIKDEQGSTTTRSYNGRDQVIEVVQPFDATRSITSRFDYDPAGNLKKGVSPRAVSKGTTVDYVVGYEYDKVNRLTRTVLPKDANTPQAYEYRRYDANGNLTLTTLPTTAADLTGVDETDKTKMEYFDPGWIYWSDDQNPRLEYDYRAEGWQTKRTPSDKKGDRRDDRADTVSYFEDGTRQTEFDRAGRPTDYKYDLNNNLVYALDKDVDGGGNQKPLQSDMTYDGFDELATSKLSAEGKPTREGTFVYDPNGNVRVRTDDKQGGATPQDPRKHVFTYDPADRLTLHEDFGRKASDASDDRRITTSYKPTGWKDIRTVLENRAGSFAKKQEMRWDYFLNGRIRTQNTQAYDKAGTQSQSESHVLEYFNDVEYVNGHRVKDTFTRKSPKAAAKCQDTACTATYVYDGRDRLTKETNTKGDGKSIDYTLDTAGNVDKQTGGPQGTVERDHSGGQQLWETVNGGPKTYSHYDDFGNLDCLTSTEPDSCAQAQSADHGPVLADYQYDPHDALQAFDDFAGHKSVDYTMDAFDRPVEERTEQSGDVKSKAMNYIGLSDQVSDEDSFKGSVASGTLEKSRAYSYGPDGEREAMTYKKAGGAEKNYSYGYDAQGSVSQLLDDDGKAQASYGYTAYGEPQDEMTQENDPDSTTGGTVDQSKDALNPYRYTGKRFNPATKQLDMGARTFAPTAQSFLQSDRYAGALDDMSLSTDPLTANRYALAAGNPVSFVEVDGHWPDFVDDAVDSAGDALSDAGDAVSDAAGDAWDASKDVGKAAFEAGKFVVGDDPLEIGLTVALTVGTGGTGLLVRTAAKAAIKGAVKAGGKKLLTKGVSALSKGAGAARSSAGASSARGAMAARGEASSLRAGSRGRTACGMNSFTPSTTVLMADGSTKRIADVRVGDIVLATDPATGTTGRHRVTNRVAGHGTKRLVYITVAGHRLTATAGHRVWAVNRHAWIEAEDLQVGDVLRGRDGRTLPVQHLRVVELAGQTAFNLTVAGVHSYYAGRSGVLVHNGVCDKTAGAADDAGEFIGPVRQSSHQIASGHAFRKHVVERGEFPDITTPEQFARRIERVVSKPTASKPLSRGRSAHYEERSNTLVIRDSRSRDGGTAFRPTAGRRYYDRLR